MIKELFQISNLLSLLRIFLAVPFWLLMEESVYPDNRMILIGLCFFAALTDVLDGHLARKLNQITELGKIIDPLADKICVAAIVIKLYMLGEIPFIFVAIIVGRDVLILIVALFLSKKINKVLPSNILGKLAVVVICLYIIVVLYGVPQVHPVYLTMYYASMVLVFVSAFGYAIRAKEFWVKN